MFRNLRGFVLGTLRAWRRRQDMNHPFFFSTNTTYQLFPVGPQEMAAWFTEIRRVGWFSGFLLSCFDAGWDTWFPLVSPSHGMMILRKLTRFFDASEWAI